MGKEDAGGGYQYFDRGKYSVRSQCRYNELFDLSLPADQNADDNMSSDEVLFCNISEEMLYNLMESLVPTLGEEQYPSILPGMPAQIRTKCLEFILMRRIQ
eukprot:2924897-Ditylum_brightwellii.AAC.1